MKKTKNCHPGKFANSKKAHKKSLRGKHEELHFRKRFKERFGIVVDDMLYNNFINAIRNNKDFNSYVVADCIYRETNTRLFYKFTMPNFSFIGIYNKSTGSLVTAFPETYIQFNGE